MREALGVETVLVPGDSAIPTVLTANTHWRLRGRLGLCRARAGDLATAHEHLLESWLGL